MKEQNFRTDSYITTIEKVNIEGRVKQDAKIVIHQDMMWYFGRFETMEQLNKLADTLGFKYQIIKHEKTESNGDFKIYGMTHRLLNGYFNNISEIPKGSRPIKALSNGSIVDCYFFNDGENITIYRPNPNNKELYKPLTIQEHIKHCEVYGSY